MIGFFKLIFGFYSVKNKTLSEPSVSDALVFSTKEPLKLLRQKEPAEGGLVLLDGMRFFKANGFWISLFAGSYILRSNHQGILFLPGRIRQAAGLFILLFILGTVYVSVNLNQDDVFNVWVSVLPILISTIVMTSLILGHRVTVFTVYARYMTES